MQMLGKRAIAAGWIWAPGSLVWGGDRITEDTLGIAHGVVPDFNDAPTRGALLEQVRTDWDDIGLHAVGLYRDGAWHWRVRGGKHHGGTFNRATEKWHDSETAALVAALEAAPKEKGL